MVMEIVNLLKDIFEQLDGTTSLDKALNDLTIKKNYNKNTLAAAFSWIYEKTIRDLSESSERNELNSKGKRIFAEDEKILLGIKNYNYLLHLNNIGLLTNPDLEIIIEQLKLFPRELINTESINVIIISLFLEVNTLTLPGSRLLLYSSDTIN
jgi:uncharacterized protein Smg (DUF494 family)